MKKYIDFTLVKILATLYGFVVLVTVIKRLIILFRSDSFGKVDWFSFIFSSFFADWFLITFYMIIISIITKRMFSKNLKFKYIFMIHICLALFMTWFIFCTAAFTQLLIGNVDINFVFDKMLTLQHYINFFNVNLIIYFFMASVIYVYFYIEKLNKIEVQRSSLQKQLLNTKMDILKAQLQPHFLFNTLNSISTLIETNPKQAQNTLVDLSDLLRNILDLKDSNFVTLKSEISLLKKYIYIMEVRFSDHLSIKYKISKDVKNALVPNMLLQPIIENSVKHGYSAKIKTLDIILAANKKNNKLIIEIFNSGEQIKDDFLNNGNGIKNILNRLKTLYNENFSFEFYNVENEDKGVKTIITIPFNKST